MKWTHRSHLNLSVSITDANLPERFLAHTYIFDFWLTFAPHMAPLWSSFVPIIHTPSLLVRQKQFELSLIVVIIMEAPFLLVIIMRYYLKIMP